MVIKKQKINKKEEINPKNLEIYEKYLCSCYIKSRETIDTTYKVYKSNMLQFLKFLKNMKITDIWYQTIQLKIFMIFGKNMPVFV